MVTMAILQSSIDHGEFFFSRGWRKVLARNTSLESMGSPRAIGQAVTDGYETPLRTAVMQRAQWTLLGWRAECLRLFASSASLAVPYGTYRGVSADLQIPE